MSWSVLSVCDTRHLDGCEFRPLTVNCSVQIKVNNYTQLSNPFTSFSSPQPRRSSIWSTCSTARCPSSAQETRVPSCRPATRKNAPSCIIHSHFTITYWSCSHPGNLTLALWTDDCSRSWPCLWGHPLPHQMVFTSGRQCVKCCVLTLLIKDDTGR